MTDRVGPLLGGRTNRTVPLPTPFAPSATVTHDTLVAVVHEQPGSIVTAMLISSGPLPASYHRGLIVATHRGAGVGGGVGGGVGVGCGVGGGVGDGVGAGAGAGDGLGVGDGAGAGGGTGADGGIGAAPCVTRTVALPTVRDPERVAPSFGATLNAIVALPVPAAGVIDPIQEASVRAVHEQPSVAVRATAVECPFSSTAMVDGDRSNRHGAAAWATSTV